METPATSVPSMATMIAPKRVVMIDDPNRAITHLADIDLRVLDHPSQAAGAKRRQRRRTKSMLRDQRVLGKAPVSCSTCRITYLPSAIPAPSPSSEGWVCGRNRLASQSLTSNQTVLPVRSGS